VQPFDIAWNLLKLERKPATPVPLKGRAVAIPESMDRYGASLPHATRGSQRQAEQREFERRELDSLDELPPDFKAQEPPE